VSIVEFQRQKPPREDVCKRCFREGMLRWHAAMAEHVAERETAAGRDPADHPAYRYYTQSPEEIMRGPGRRRRERLRTVTRVPYERHEIFERDGWRCWICGDPVPEAEASVDHVVPIAQGGADAPANLRLAHRGCNSRRGWRDPSGTTRLLKTSVDEERWDRWDR
jgi:5-methylcytosine-specific restriction endonuclease McrA